ncbi:hypothetical protein [Mycolicibacterium llatzerense]|uniref:hypothetical protein n=1 Tax=Mycolicibacterium llatzerense TaxID=280871 RepID=UPI0021B5D3E7|nr:hypothetical protein [Mycolicibacterium llatzerense]MCT7361342.1 hypothetical protein [Mycolicibacterium llatzerense]
MIGWLDRLLTWWINTVWPLDDSVRGGRDAAADAQAVREENELIDFFHAGPGVVPGPGPGAVSAGLPPTAPAPGPPLSDYGIPPCKRVRLDRVTAAANKFQR